jgi:biopolymer transport protein ExbB
MQNDPSQNLLSLIQQGGWSMWPLGLCSLAFIYLLIHTWRNTHANRLLPPTARLYLQGLHMHNQSFDAATIPEPDAPVVRSLIEAFQMGSDNKPSLTHFEERLDRELSSIAQWIQYLNVVATVSPMIGLLGTVSGMIGAFQTIAGGGMGKPELLANDIGEALITTAAGMAIGIPAMIAYFALRHRLEHQCSHCLECLQSFWTVSLTR